MITMRWANVMTRPSFGEHQYATPILMPASRNLQQSGEGRDPHYRCTQAGSLEDGWEMLLRLLRHLDQGQPISSSSECGLQGWFEL